MKRKKIRLYRWMLPGEKVETMDGKITSREWVENEVKRINKENPARQAYVVRSPDRKISINVFEADGVTIY